MTHAGLAALARRAAAWVVIGLGLTIPISTAADGVLLALLLLAWLAAAPASMLDARRAVLTIPPVTIAVALFTWLLAGCFYGEATPRAALSGIAKYIDLAFIPLIVWGAADADVRRRALVCFGIAIVLSLYVSYSAAAGLPGLRNPEYPIGFKASIAHSIFVSLGAFLFLLAAREAADRRWRIGFAALAALCAHNVLFIVIGRTGYIVLAVLLAYFVVATLRTRRLRAIALLACSLLLPVTYLAAPSFRDRVHEAYSDISRWRGATADEGTSVGLRLEYARKSMQIISEHPLAGVGTGGFAAAYAEKAKGSLHPTAGNPHNEYAMLGVQIGVPGIALLAALFTALWIAAARLGSRFDRDLARGLALAMAVAGLFNSVLLDHAEGLLFAWLTGLLCAAYRGSRGLAPAPAAA